ncbi:MULTISPECIES: DUF2393 family protein [unclassified Campylobacter]|uniref:DUF2393 family protein n=1 Tax=unclassified Campylobacter TaxID=2593542 RepID=UPI003D32D871
MSASYFTIVHYAIIGILTLLSVLFLILSTRADRKLLIPLIFTNFLVTTALIVFLMLVIDKYTKKGRLDNVTSYRVLMNESIVFKGTVTNIGRFTISNCNFTVKLVNQPLNKDTLKGENLFKPSGLSMFSWLFNDNQNDKPNTVEYKFSVVKNLPAKKSVPFTVSMPFPPYFSKTMHITKISCY